MRFLYLTLLIFLVSCQDSSNDVSPSPTVPGQEVPAQPRPPTSPPDEFTENAPTGSAEKVAIPVAEVASLGAGRLPAWPGTLDQLNQFVQFSRNERLYKNPNPGQYLRRAPWYYGGGCYAKAAHISALAEKNGYPRAGKVFAFGGWATMRFKSPYLPGGAAWWGYHVVAAYHIQSQVFVLDPLVSPDRALTVDEWIKAIAPKPEKISISFCDENSYSPTDRCIGGNRNGAYTGHIPEMLRREYRSLKSLGYNPDMVL